MTIITKKNKIPCRAAFTNKNKENLCQTIGNARVGNFLENLRWPYRMEPYIQGLRRRLDFEVGPARMLIEVKPYYEEESRESNSNFIYGVIRDISPHILDIPFLIVAGEPYNPTHPIATFCKDEYTIGAFAKNGEFTSPAIIARRNDKYILTDSQLKKDYITGETSGRQGVPCSLITLWRMTRDNIVLFEDESDIF